MLLKILVIFLFFINSSYSHELRPAIANLNVYQKDNVFNANLSIRLNLESIIAEIDFDHSNTEFSEKSNEYKKLRSMDSDELLKKYNFKIKELVNNIHLLSANHDYNLSLKNINIPEVGNLDIIRDTIINFDIKNLKNEEHIFYWGKTMDQ
jgi:aminopeptidase C